jgi:hypothetical protein
MGGFSISVSVFVWFPWMVVVVTTPRKFGGVASTPKSGTNRITTAVRAKTIMTTVAIKRHLLGFLGVILSDGSSLLTPERVASRGVKFYL